MYVRVCDWIGDLCLQLFMSIGAEWVKMGNILLFRFHGVELLFVG